MADEEILRRLCRDAAVSSPGEVEYASCSPTAFYREFVSARRPCIIKGGMSGWAGVSKWTSPYLCDKMSDSEVTIALTPNGRADAITDIEGEALFMLPDEKRMQFSEFAAKLHGPEATIYYAQKQNNSFNEEYQPLHEDVDPGIEKFGTEIFGEPPSAVNFWMGGDKTVSSLHKDPFENLYSVVRGTKKFLLLPPWEGSSIPYNTHKQGVWRHSGDGFSVERLDSEVKWAVLDPNHKRYYNTHPIEVIVNAGETLYLPGLWYHEVSQYGDEEGTTIAVNYWYDMQYNPSYYLLEAVRRLGTTLDDGQLSDDEDFP
eukprot:TRINITY_DN20611_c0_g1_i1.p1 TRINITY_DN20611_c0_g1~~TRINITY_DN20611_c0_g1_i1.p1  ORF type:complete len:327 (+),score=46.34 TRINITY_DN20611_c0_g1_i1:38-982(+)